MQNTSQSIYKTPFTRAYWQDAVHDFRQLHTLTFSALMVAACVALSKIPPIQIDQVRVTWGFLARALCSMVGGPVNAIVFGVVEDNLSFMLHPSGPYFPGYTLTTVLGNLIYALLLYRTRVTVVRVGAAKLLTNGMNVVLGSLWSYILYGKKSYFVYMVTSAVKNAVMFPIQTVLLVLLFGALGPILRRMGLVPAMAGEGRGLPLY